MWVGSVFAGIGGFDVAFERAGAQAAFQVEINEHCGRILARHWPTVPRYGDVEDVTGERLRAELGIRADVDVLVGGFPCTDLSVAGGRAGLVGESSKLFWEFHRLARELRPRWLVIENVDGLLSSNGGRDMGTIVGALAELGYVGAYRCFDAQHFGLAQRRKRVFFVCHLGEPWSAPAQVLFEPESCDGDSAPLGTARPVDTGDLEDGARGDGGGTDQRELIYAPDVSKPIMSHRRSRRDDLEGGAYVVERDVTNTLTASMLSGCGPELKQAEAGFLVSVDQRAFNIDPLTGQAIQIAARETEIAQALTAVSIAKKSWRGTFVTTAPIDEEEAGILDDEDDPPLMLTDTAPAAWSTKMSHTKSNQAGKFYKEYSPGLQANSPAPVVAYQPEVAATLTAGSAASPGVNPPGRRKEDDTNLVAYRKSRRSHGAADPAETWVEDGLANTLNTFDNATAVRTTHAVVSSDWTVRRLTPMECERLQGFPDGWTAFDNKGRPVPDTARYRALGNAVAVPVVTWIARRLVEVDQQIERNAHDHDS